MIAVKVSRGFAVAVAIGAAAGSAQSPDGRAVPTHDDSAGSGPKVTAWSSVLRNVEPAIQNKAHPDSFFADTATPSDHARGRTHGGTPTPKATRATNATPRPASLSDAEILGVLDTANGGEIEQGKIASERGQAGAVRNFGALMVTEHGAAKQKGKELARKLGVTLTPSTISTNLKTKSDDLVLELKKTELAKFDDRYMRSQVTLHQDVLKLIDDKLMPQARTSDMKNFVTDIRGHVEHHLDVAKKTLTDLGPRS